MPRCWRVASSRAARRGASAGSVTSSVATIPLLASERRTVTAASAEGITTVTGRSGSPCLIAAMTSASAAVAGAPNGTICSRSTSTMSPTLPTGCDTEELCLVEPP